MRPDTQREEPTLFVSAIVPGSCHGCRYLSVASKTGCTYPSNAPPVGVCMAIDHIWITNTPEARAKYVAERLTA